MLYLPKIGVSCLRSVMFIYDHVLAKRDLWHLVHELYKTTHYNASNYTVNFVLQPFDPLPDMSILSFSNSAANKGMMSKISTNGDIII